MPTALLLDGAQRSALAVARSLGGHGIDVVVADDTRSCLAAQSRFVTTSLTSPSLSRDSESFFHWLGTAITDHAVDVVIPVTDMTTNALVLKRSLFDGSVAFVSPDLAVYDLLTDKHSLIQLAGKLEIPVPASILVEEGSPVPDAQTDSEPVVLKPTRSKFFDGNRWLSTSVKIAATPEDVANIVATNPEFQTHPWLLQQFINGVGQGIFALYDHGNAVCFFAHRRLREKPPWGGVSVLCESIELDQHMVELSRRLLDHVGWHGVAMVEFKVTPDGTPYLMEVNTRFWGSLQLAVDCGVDFPWLLWQLAMGDNPNAPAAFRTGQRLRWFLGDLDSLYITLKDTRFSRADKLKRLRDFFTPGFGNTRHEIFRWRDPAPAWFEAKQYLISHFGSR